MFTPSTHPDRTPHTHPGAASPEHHVPASEAESDGAALGAGGWWGWNPQHCKQGSTLAWYLLVSPVPERPALTKGDTGSLRPWSEHGFGSSSESSINLEPCCKDLYLNAINFVIVEDEPALPQLLGDWLRQRLAPQHCGRAAGGSAGGTFGWFTPILELF